MLEVYTGYCERTEAWLFQDVYFKQREQHVQRDRELYIVCCGCSEELMMACSHLSFQHYSQNHYLGYVNLCAFQARIRQFSSGSKIRKIMR